MIDRHVPAKLQGWLEGLWLAALAAYILAGAPLVPFHGDESTQIYMGRDYFYLFHDSDLEAVSYDSSWIKRPTEQHLRLINGTVTKTIHGFLAASAGMSREEINGQWDWQLDYAENRELGHIPEAQLLGRARLASAAQLAVSAALFYVLVRMTIGRPAAIVASGLYGLHPALLLNGRRAMMEGSHLLGMILVLLAAVWLLQGHRWWKFVLLGVASGFAVAAKHPNAFVVALVFFACAALWLYQTARVQGQARRRPAQALIGLLAAGGLALFSFYLMNPAWWQAPLDSAAEVLRLRAGLLNEQVARYGGYDSSAERIEGFLEYAFFDQSQYYEVAQWAGYDAIRAQISAYESSGLAGLAIDGKLGGLIMAGLSVWGIVYLARAPQIDRKYRWLLLVWGGGIAGITLLVTPLPWQRYYLPVLPFAQLAAACAVAHLIRSWWHRMESRTQHDLSLSD
ncbi:MAG: phospholipid carrier-dependent glycosyltransferase [Chloroflexi bacterium]|nr:phospholipid carrier-dependent glycosyltransferase [Chloroflexota bacterium]